MKQEYKIIKLPDNYLLNFYKFKDLENRSFSLITDHSKTERNVEDDYVKGRSCYKRIMQTPDLTVQGKNSIKNLELLTAMIGKSPNLEKLHFEDMIFTKDHKTALANVAKAKFLHKLYINFDNMIPGSELASAELANSNSLIEIYIRFRCTAWHTIYSYYAIIKPLFKIPTLKKLMFQLCAKEDCEGFADENNAAISEMIKDHFKERTKESTDENYSKIISANFYPSFIALHYGDIPLAIDVIGNIAKQYGVLSSFDVEYSYYR